MPIHILISPYHISVTKYAGFCVVTLLLIVHNRQNLHDDHTMSRINIRETEEEV